MINDESYRKSFFIAIGLHVFLALLLLVESTSQRPVLMAAKNEPSKALPVESTTQPKEIVKAVSVDNQEIMQTVNRLKQERANQLKAEQARQQALKHQAEMARKVRLQEQQRLARLKEEAEKIAIARKKQIEEEQKRLKQLALQKEQEAKRLAELKEKQQQLQKKQQEEAQKLAQLKKKQAEEKLKVEKDKIEKEKAEKAKELARLEKEKAQKAKEALAQAEKAKAERERQAAAQQAAENAKQAHIAGEVDKYKALIVNAISRHWILPENVNQGLSSQFRIRLAPDGAVLEVTLIRSSGDPILDRSAQTAIYKASPLPVPNDPETFDIFRDISLTVRPENVRG
ncbi:cell envelope integrity protein TolA [Legionella jamestowniensis]|uniref:TolA colicin import membrane protein n=1 Tax=Legionella jamestowniensis TaxID=455 RepID=A0A0W0UJU7_9GAMM|nr:cell envelope integrity protein TolA [Legionella jamestowniensis]KTD08163.1 TolA colicin import membrane protein [Legionella jamestowniensis]SFL99099.1 Cell division and transport-associated protein TolA (TC 2.C.1.2.1) [Legionella jamestowniensis DSM 19215]